jgi:hypothetical protein
VIVLNSQYGHGSYSMQVDATIFFYGEGVIVRTERQTMRVLQVHGKFPFSLASQLVPPLGRKMGHLRE